MYGFTLLESLRTLESLCRSIYYSRADPCFLATLFVAGARAATLMHALKRAPAAFANIRLPVLRIRKRGVHPSLPGITCRVASRMRPDFYELLSAGHVTCEVECTIGRPTFPPAIVTRVDETVAVRASWCMEVYPASPFCSFSATRAFLFRTRSPVDVIVARKVKSGSRTHIHRPKGSLQRDSTTTTWHLNHGYRGD